MLRFSQILADNVQPPDIVTDVGEMRVTVYMGFVSFMILIWEHIITFNDEVQYIWKGKKGIIVYLFFLNRYLTPFGFIINLFAYLSPTWTPERCQDFVRYEGCMTVTGLNTTGLMMFLRVYALYPRRYMLLAFVLAVLGIEFGVNAYLLSHGVAVVHNRQVHACTMVFDPSVPKGLAAGSAYLPLLYDTVILVLTLNRTLAPVRQRTAGKIMRVLLRDGLLYYAVIFAINLILTIMIAAAPQGIQNITAQMEYLLTVAMMSRITIHLKKQGRFNNVPSEDKATIQTIGQSLGGIFPSHFPFSRSNGGTTSGNTNHNRTNPQVTVTIEELVTRDDDQIGESDVDAQSDLSKHATSSILPHPYNYNLQSRQDDDDDVKKPEWHEMRRVR